jgi:hypothetical protein
VGKPLQLVHERDVIELMFENRGHDSTCGCGIENTVFDSHSFEAQRRLRDRLGRRRRMLRDYARFTVQAQNG